MPQCDVEDKWLDHIQLTLGGHLILQSKAYKSYKGRDYKKQKNEDNYLKRANVRNSIEHRGLWKFKCVICHSPFNRDELFKIKKITQDQMKFLNGDLFERSRNTGKFVKIDLNALVKRFTPEERLFLMEIKNECFSPNKEYFLVCMYCVDKKDRKGKDRLYATQNSIDRIDLYEDDIHNPKFESDLFKNRVNIS